MTVKKLYNKIVEARGNKKEGKKKTSFERKVK